MRINHNIAALNTYRQLSTNSASGQKSLEKLSSGLRINRAGDDAAGLAISEKMRGQIKGLDQASRNAQDAISLVQTAEGALNESHSILQRMRELAVQSATDTNTNTDRGSINTEVSSLITELTRISTDTEFNESKLLNGSLGGAVNTAVTVTTALAVTGITSVTSNGAKAGTYAITSTGAGTLRITNGTKSVGYTVAAGQQTINATDFSVEIKTSSTFLGGSALAATNIVVTSGQATFHIGANKNQNITLNIKDMSATGLSVNAVDVSTRTKANDAILTVNTAIGKVSDERSKLGALQNRLEHTINNLNTSSENLVASESRIRDVDMAKEMMEFTKNNILTQASQAMLAQANQQPQGVLQLLR